ncbi:hypothetical protein CEP54_013822 [Fusarium duplospermum]|uniref:Uncharacterized protein n=1 Tax=Fusarium duplospermum TaxID=1325734 RepID=A0A428P0A0_9HYPO|nr:hypothetical protein CEP54_013822 [Fusarium duplospermum]
MGIPLQVFQTLTVTYPSDRSLLQRLKNAKRVSYVPAPWRATRCDWWGLPARKFALDTRREMEHSHEHNDDGFVLSSVLDN